MTRKEFKAAMLRGHGRCVIAVREEPEKYRDLVLWACKRDYAFDAQSEGTRSWYTYTLINAYPDKETFIHLVAEVLKKYRPNGSWDLLHLSEILMFFAMDGYEIAQKALEEKYQEALARMFALTRRPNRVFHELSDLEQLGLVLVEDSKSFLRIAEDFGRLYQEKKYLYDGDFAWFFANKGGKYRRSMEAAARKNENIACFMKREQADIDAREQRWKEGEEEILRKRREKREREKYTAEKAKLLEPRLRELISKKDWEGVHTVGLDIYRVFYESNDIPHPKHLLPLLYEYNPCSFCRETALAYMSKHRMLTKEVLEECQYDSNYDIRKMATKRLEKGIAPCT